MLKNIINIGVSEHQFAYIQNRIRITNITILVAIPIALIYLLFYVLYFPPVVPVLLMSLGFICAALLLNYLLLHYIARFIISVVMLLLCSVIHGYAIPAGEIPQYGMMVFLFALATLPWLLMDVREYILLSFTIAFNLFILMNQSVFIDYLETNHPKDLFEQAFFTQTLVFSSFIILSLLLFILNFRDWRSDKKNQKLVNDLQEQNIFIINQQETLKKQIEETETQQTEIKQRNWQSVVLRNLAQLVQSALSEEEILQKYLFDLVRALDAHQGAIYLLKQDEQSEKTLRLEVAFAGDLERKKNQEILWGQGFVGQCAANKKTIYIKDIPAESFKIGSGLGQAAPKSILLVPIIFQENIEGVIEILGIDEIELYKRKLLEIAGGNLGAWVFNQKSYRYTKYLLEKAQAQADTLAENDNALKRNFAELQATKKDLEQREEDYRKIIEELRQELEAIKNKSHES